MDLSESSLELHNKLEELKKTLSKNKFELINLDLKNVVLFLKEFISLKTLNEIILEFLIKLSEAIYLKSLFLLNIHTKDKEEKEANTERLKFESKFIEKKLNYCEALPLERILFEKVFLIQVPGIRERFGERNFWIGVHKNLILKAILSVLDQERFKEGILKKFTFSSIEVYLEVAKEYLERKISFSFEELIEEKLGEEQKEDFLEIAYYFLAFLFLCLEGLCYMIQNNENENIIIFSKIYS